MRKRKNEKGRPSVITDEVIKKLIAAFKMGLSIREAAAFADVSKTAIYEFIDSNTEFKDKIKTLQATPSMLAKVAIYGAIAAGDLEICKWHLDRQAKRELERERAGLIRLQKKELERANNPESLPDAIVDLTGHWARVDAYFSSREQESEKQEGEAAQ